MPEKTPLRAIRHGRIERDDFAVERVILESRPGHFVTGSLFLPLAPKGKIPAILSPHGHWNNGRFYDALTDGGGQAAIDKSLASGGEQDPVAARLPLQARCIHLARLGFAVFHYDMEGYADSVQLPHRTGPRIANEYNPEGLFGSVSADLWLQTPLALQTWNSIRALDFLSEQPEVDPARIGVTGASGGGTQTMMLTGADPRIAAAFPVAMASTGMQGGCVCENSHYLRIDAGNIDIAALTAPRPLGLISADDWTKNLEKDGAPELRSLYDMLGQPGHFTAAFFTRFPHGYNQPMRRTVYGFFWKHLLGKEGDPPEERPFAPLTREELTVWDDHHPKPATGTTAHEAELLGRWRMDMEQTLARHLAPATAEEAAQNRALLKTAWMVMLGGVSPSTDAATGELKRKDEINGGWRLETSVTPPLNPEPFPTVYWHPATWNKTVVVWLSPGGVSAREDGGTPGKECQALLDHGFTLACPDLSWPTEGLQVPPRKKTGWEASSLFHFGYNRPLLAGRADDVIALLRLIRSHERKPERVVLAGEGPCSALAALVALREEDLVDDLFLDTGGWRFSGLASPWDPFFVPGAAKYGDLPGLLFLRATRHLWIGGETVESVGKWRAGWDLPGAGHDLAIDASGGAAALVRAIIGP
jgi:hypothetical protein